MPWNVLVVISEVVNKSKFSVELKDSKQLFCLEIPLVSLDMQHHLDVRYIPPRHLISTSGSQSVLRIARFRAVSSDTGSVELRCFGMSWVEI